MSLVEKPKNNEVVAITLPPDTTKALQELQGSLTNQNLAKLKDDVESRNVQQKMKTVFTQLDSLAVEHPELVSTIEDIKAYLVLLQHGQKPDVKDATDVALDFTRSYRSRHARIVSFWESQTTWWVWVSVPDTTVASTDATGRSVTNYDAPIKHGDLFSSPDFQVSAKRGEEYLKAIAVWPVEKPAEKTPDDVAKLKASFESAMNTPVTNEELKKRLSESLKEAKTQNDRALAIQMILEWMRHHNYVVLLGEKWYEVRKSDDGGKTFPIQQEFMNIMSAHGLTDTDIQNSLIVWSEYFNNFVESYTVDGRLSKSLDSKEYLRQLRQHYKLSENPTIDEIKKNKDITPRDRDLLLSAAMNTGIASVDITSQAQSILAMKQQFADLENINPQYRSILQAAIVGGGWDLGSGTWSGGSNPPKSGQFQWVFNDKTWENYGKDPNGTFNDMMRTSPGSALVSFFIMLFLVKKWTGSWLATLWAAIWLPVLAANGKAAFDGPLKFLTGKTWSEGGAQDLQEATWDKLQQWFDSRFSASNVDQTTIDKKIAGKNILLTQNGKTPIDNYQVHLNYLKSNTLLSSLSAKELLLGNPDTSLWSNKPNLYTSTPNNIDSAIFKSMLRHLILWEDSVPSILNGNLPDMRAIPSSIPKDKLNTWLQKNHITEADLTNMTVKDLLKKIHS